MSKMAWHGVGVFVTGLERGRLQKRPWKARVWKPGSGEWLMICIILDKWLNL